MRTRAVSRIRIVTGAVLFLCLILLARLYQIQILHHEEYLTKAEKQYVHTSNDLFDRGSIYFTTKDGEKMSAASLQTGYVLAVNPTLINDAQALYETLSPYIEQTKEQFVYRATLPERTYVEITTTLPSDAAAVIDELDLSGVLLYRNQWRYYPGNEVAARTVGFIGYTEDPADGLRGRYGLERYYDEVLRREQDGLTVNFFAEIFTNLGNLVFDTSSTRKGDIVTTIEPTVARRLDSVLHETNEKWSSRVTGGIIMNPKTGEIYAMNVVPSFNLNDRRGASIEEFSNPLVEGVYEFGSIVKALTMASGLDSGAVSPRTTYYDAGVLELDTFTISNYDGRGRGTVDMQEVLNQSLNTGVAFVVDTMGKDKFREYFKSLKLGSETGIDLPNETHGLIHNLDSPRDIEYATASYGQGIALTPIGVARALSTLGNGGVLVNPHIVSRVEYLDGTSREVTFPEGQRVFSEETSEEISRMLTTVVDDALAGGTVALPNHTVAAKTGTAQIADSENGGYYDDRYLHSFFGYFPAYDPEFLIFLYTIEPKEVRYASETLTDPFMEMTHFLVNYYDIPPDR